MLDPNSDAQFTIGDTSRIIQVKMRLEENIDLRRIAKVNIAASGDPSRVQFIQASNSERAQQVYISPVFLTAFNDSGSGAVDTSEDFGGSAATFTRATVAWTKLSTGLWTQVASGVARSGYFGATTAVGEYGGFFSELAGTQLVTPDASIRDMTNAAWTATNVTPLKNGIGIDGVTNSCSRLTCGSNGGKITQTLTAAASSRTYSCWIKRVTGTGTISLTQDDGSTSTDVTASINSSTFTRVELTASQLNAVFGIIMGTATDVILVDFNQFEAGAEATSPMATAGAARNADVLTYVFSGNALAATGSAYGELLQNSTSTAVTRMWAAFASNDGVLFRAAASALTTQAIADAGATNTVTKTGLNSLATAVRKRACSWGAAGLAITGDGAAAATGNFNGTMGSTAIYVGHRNGSLQPNGMIKNYHIWRTQFPASLLTTITT